MVVVGHIPTVIELINVVQVFLYSTRLSDIRDLVKSSVQFIVIPIVFFFDILSLLTGCIPASIIFPLFQSFTFTTKTNISKLWQLISELSDNELVLNSEDPSLQVFHIILKFGRWWYVNCLHYPLTTFPLFHA